MTTLIRPFQGRKHSQTLNPGCAAKRRDPGLCDRTPLAFTHTLLVTIFAFTFSLATAAEPPIGASIRVTNGGTSCSGTIFTVGTQRAAAVGAAHCFAGRIGGEFDCLIGEKTVKAKLVAIDKPKDLALWSLPASAVTAVAEFPDQQPQGPMTAIGYPAGVPTAHVKKLKYHAQHAVGDARFDWQCEVVDGRFEGGDSGGGVFLDGRLAGVIHGKETQFVCETGRSCRQVTYLHCVCFRDVRDFVKSHEPLIADCRGGQVPTLAAKDAPPPPSEKLYDGKGARPHDLDSDCRMAAEIDKLRKELADLKSQISNLKSPAAPAPGAKGDRGPAGANGEKGTITVILTDAAGKEISRASDVTSGSVVRLNVKRFQK